MGSKQPKGDTVDYDYDLIVIGSGIGGLTVASIMAQLEHKRVLILDRHFKVGGLTHTFRRHKYEWDTGVHYVGNMKPGRSSRRFMDLVTGGAVEWRRMTDPYDHFIYPDRELAVPSGSKRYQAELAKQYPGSRREIRRYFRAMSLAANWGERTFAAKILPPQIGPALLAVGRKVGSSTTAAVLERYITDPSLRSMLASQWGDIGLPPGRSAFAQHAIVAKDFLDGAYYPAEGGADIAAAVVAIVEAAGGSCLTKHTVTKLDIENNRVTRVWAEHRGQPVSFTAPRVVSAIGAAATYQGLVPADHPLAERALLAEDVDPPTAVILNVGLKEDPRPHGFGEGNYWMFDDIDHDKGYDQRHKVAKGEIHGCFLSFPSLRLAQPDRFTAQVITISDYASWQEWADQPWLKRDDGYQQAKQLVSQSLIDFVERFQPGFASLVDYHELATPLTVNAMMGHRMGGIYGHPATPKRFTSGAFPVVSASVDNLYLAGCDVGCLGLNGAMMGGVMTAALLLGSAGYPRLQAAIRRKRRPLPPVELTDLGYEEAKAAS